MLSIDYYHKIKDLFPKEVHKSEFIYFYTMDGVVESISFKKRKKHDYKMINDIPHEKLLLSREKKLPQYVIVQVKFNPLTFNLLEG